MDPEAARDDEPVASDGEEAPARTARLRSLGFDAIDRYLPVIAIIGMVVTYLQVPTYFALTFIALVWLLATRVTRNRRFLGLSLTEALAWDATVLIFLGLAFNVLAAAQPAT